MCFTLPYSLARIYMDLRSLSYLISTSGLHSERDWSRRNLSYWIIKSSDYLQSIKMLILILVLWPIILLTNIIGSSTVWVAIEMKLIASLLCIFLQESKDYRIRELEKLKDEWVFYFHWLLWYILVILLKLSTMPIKILFMKVRRIALNTGIEPLVANSLQFAWAWTLIRIPILKPWQILTLLSIWELSFLFVKIHGLDGKVVRSKCNLPLSLLNITIDTECKIFLEVSIAQRNDNMNPIHIWPGSWLRYACMYIWLYMLDTSILLQLYIICDVVMISC